MMGRAKRRARRVDAELSALGGRDPRALTEAIGRLVGSHARGTGQEAAFADVARIIEEGMVLSDLLGRRRVHLLLGAEGVTADDMADVETGTALNDLEPDTMTVAAFASEAFPVVPDVGFDSAVASILSRHPILARTGIAVAKAYERWGFAAARSVDDAVTSRLQRFIAKLANEGAPVPTAKAAIAEMTGWSKAYSQTVYRTNLTTAYTAGEFQEMRKPGVSKFMLGFQVIGSRDADTRRGRAKEDGGENHLAAVGLVAPTEDAIWRTHTTPYGYNCRHSMRPVTKFEAKRKGWLDANGNLRRVEPAQFSSFRPHRNFIANTAGSLYS